jgi:hypothetical protein
LIHKVYQGTDKECTPAIANLGKECLSFTLLSVTLRTTV